MSQTRSKHRLRELAGAILVPEWYASDHLRVGTMHSGFHPVDVDEVISYGVGEMFNPCNHQKITDVSGSDWSRVGTMSNHTWRVTGGVYSSGTSPTFEPVAGRDYGLTEVYWSVWPSRSITIPETTADNSRLDAWNRLTHLTPDPHWNAMQAVLELKDSKQTMSQVVQFTSWAKSMMGRRVKVSMRALARRRRGLGVHLGPVKPISLVLSATTKLATVASAYLWYKFGVEPTVQDVQTFLKELSNGRLRAYTERKPKTLARKGQVVVSRFHATLPTPDLLEAVFGSDRPTSGTGVLSLSRGQRTNVSWPFTGLTNARPVYGRKLTVHGEIRGCYFARANTDIEISGLQNMRRTLEWNCPSFRTMWELTPFSFLVDWIVDVGKTIERYEKRYCTQNMERYLSTPWIAQRSSRSVYYPIVSGSAEVSARTPPSSVYDGGTLNLRWNAEYKVGFRSRTTAFVRRPVTNAPSVAWPELSRSIKAYQISSGMALLLQAAKQWMR